MLFRVCQGNGNTVLTEVGRKPATEPCHTRPRKGIQMVKGKCCGITQDFGKAKGSQGGFQLGLVTQSQQLGLDVASAHTTRVMLPYLV